MEEEHNLVELRNDDSYSALVEECQSIIVEGVFNFRMEKILTYGRLGERIFNDELYNKYGKGNAGFLRKLAIDIGINYSDLARAIQFYEKFKIVSPDSESWSVFEEGKNISWSKIKQKYLPTNPAEECQHDLEEMIVWGCRMCKRIFREKPEIKKLDEKNRT